VLWEIKTLPQSLTKSLDGVRLWRYAYLCRTNVTVCLSGCVRPAPVRSILRPRRDSRWVRQDDDHL